MDDHRWKLHIYDLKWLWDVYLSVLALSQGYRVFLCEKRAFGKEQELVSSDLPLDFPKVIKRLRAKNFAEKVNESIS
jgi:hypothetical protein